MSIGESLLPEFDQEMSNTRKVLTSLPDDKFGWKPHEKSMTLARLASHLAEFPNWALVTLQTDHMDFTPEDKPFLANSRAELLAKFDKDVAAVRPLIGGISDADLFKPWKLTFQGQLIFEMPKAATLRGMVMNHMIHHRAQLGVYLRLLDIPVPGMYGPSADEKG